MKKISILSLHLGYGGIERCVTSLANSLCSKYEVEIAVCYKMFEESAFKLDKRVNIIYLNNDDIVPNRDKFRKAIKNFDLIKTIKEGLFSLKVLRLRKSKMIDYLKKCDSDVIISTRDIFNFWSSKYGNNKSVKIGWEHNHFHNDLKYARKVCKSVKNLDYFVLVSSNLKDAYEKMLGNSKCKCLYIPNTIDEIPVNASTLSENRFISVGRLSPEKGYLDLLKVFSKVHEIYPDWSLDIIGDGTEREKLEEYISTNGLREFVTLHGFQGKDYINDLLSNSSIYLMCSYTEAFGIVLIEAMSHGVPCIAFSSAEGACEIIDNSKNGFLIDGRDMNQMVEKIKLLVDDKKLRIKMGNIARESVVKYTSDVVSKQWFKLIEESGINE